MNKILKTNKKSILIIIFGLLLLIPFQNCSNKGFEVETSASGNSKFNNLSTDSSSTTTDPNTSSGSTTSPGSTNTGTTPVTTNPPSTGTGSTVIDPAEQARLDQLENERQARCAANVKKPVIVNAANLNNLVFSLNSGLATGSGDKNSTLQEVQVDPSRGIIDNSLTTPKASGGDGCNYSTSVRITAIDPATDATHPAALSEGINLAGASVISQTMKTFDLARSVVTATPNNNNSAFPGSNAINIGFQITNNNNRILRCAAGSLYYKVQARVQTVGLTNNRNVTIDSDPSFVKVQFANSCWNESKLLASTAIPKNANAGTKVVLSGAWAAVLAPKDADIGAVYMFNNPGSGWVFKQRITMPGAAAGDALSNLDLKGNYLVVSNAQFASKGKVYVFTNQGGIWTATQNFTSPENILDQMFGVGLALGTNELAVGSPDHPRVGNDSGRVYIYNLVNGQFSYSQFLDGVNGTNDSAHYSFGSTIVFNGAKLAISAPALMGSDYKGRVFIFSKSTTWGYERSILPPADASLGAAFGNSIAFVGTALVIGAELNDNGTRTDAGAIYYYSNYTGAVTRKLQGNGTNSNFGKSVALTASSLFVSSIEGGVDLGLSTTGQISRFLLTDLNNTGLNTVPTIFLQKSHDNNVNNTFGSSMATDGGSTLMVGAPSSNDPFEKSGLAYIYIVR